MLSCKQTEALLTCALVCAGKTRLNWTETAKPTKENKGFFSVWKTH